MRYGYARVSSKSQDYAGQVEALKAAGCERIFADKLSGKSRARPELKKLMRRLAPGDVVVVTKLDRIARSVRDLWNLLHEIIEENGGQFISLREGWCDTTTAAGKLMVTVMGGVAEFERELIRERCEEGIERAKRKGTKFGRPSALDASQRRRIAERYSAGESMSELARDYECGETTIWRALRRVIAELARRSQMSILAPADLPDNDAEILVVLARVRLWPAPASVQNRRGRCHARGRRNFLFEQTAKRPNS